MFHILIAEDDSVLSDGMVRSLRHAGYAVDSAADGEAAVNAADCDGIDLLILDLGLPKMDGAEVLRRVRMRHPQLLVLLISALDGADRCIELAGLKVDDYLPKPFGLEEFETRIRKLTRRDDSL